MQNQGGQWQQQGGPYGTPAGPGWQGQGPGPTPKKTRLTVIVAVAGVIGVLFACSLCGALSTLGDRKAPTTAPSTSAASASSSAVSVSDLPADEEPPEKFTLLGHQGDGLMDCTWRNLLVDKAIDRERLVALASHFRRATPDVCYRFFDDQKGFPAWAAWRDEPEPASPARKKNAYPEKWINQHHLADLHPYLVKMGEWAWVLDSIGTAMNNHPGMDGGSIDEKFPWKKGDCAGGGIVMPGLGDVVAGCKQLVLDNLRSPKSADFQGIFDGRKDPEVSPACRVSWSSYVDAKNAFGAEIRTKFTCTWKPHSDSLTLEVH